jgi:Transglutaminase-like superfamily
MIALYRRFTALERSQRRLVVEAAALMAIVWIGLRMHRFLMLRRMLDRFVALTSTHAGVAHPVAIGSVRSAITAVAVRFPAATCLVQALAADAMLRRRRLASELRLGVRLRDLADRADAPSVPIEAHAWVECDGGVVIGAVAHQSEFKVLTR